MSDQIIDAVIGANYGDEGKGQTVHNLIRKRGMENQSIVIRYNGGAQAGHTVIENDNRFVFSHIGAGAMCGSDTYLSQFFVCEPHSFNRQFVEVQSFAKTPCVFVHPACLVTTPIDVAMDALENDVGVTTGMGFGKTIARSQTVPIFISDSSEEVKRKLCSIQKTFCLKHGLNLGEFEHLRNITCFDVFLHEFNVMKNRIAIGAYDPRFYKHIVFEGSQGLGLDQNSTDFPYVTRSNTGWKNIAELCTEFQLGDVHTHYISRAYLTRHGAGFLDHEIGQLPREIDRTNLPNLYQGAMRYARFGLEELANRIQRDQSFIRGNGPCELVITCRDHLIKLGLIDSYGASVKYLRTLLKDFSFSTQNTM